MLYSTKKNRAQQYIFQSPMSGHGDGEKNKFNESAFHKKFVFVRERKKKLLRQETDD